MTRIIIELDEHEPAETVREIARQLEAGFTSGYYPTWRFESDDGHPRRALIHA